MGAPSDRRPPSPGWPARVPGHVAIIMDGNGRWANARGLRRNAGHEAGEEALFRTVEGALALGIRDLTLYAFSTENWRRSPEEVRFLLDFNRSLLLRRVDELIDRDVRVRFIGRRARPVPRRLVDLIERTDIPDFLKPSLKDRLQHPAHSNQHIGHEHLGHAIADRHTSTWMAANRAKHYQLPLTGTRPGAPYSDAPFNTRTSPSC